MQYGNKLSTKHPSETNNNFENYYLKLTIFLNNNYTIYSIPINIKIFLNHNKIGLKHFANIRSDVLLFQIQIDRQK